MSVCMMNDRSGQLVLQPQIVRSVSSWPLQAAMARSVSTLEDDTLGPTRSGSDG